MIKSMGVYYFYTMNWVFIMKNVDTARNGSNYCTGIFCVDEISYVKFKPP